MKSYLTFLEQIHEFPRIVDDMENDSSMYHVITPERSYATTGQSFQHVANKHFGKKNVSRIGNSNEFRDGNNTIQIRHVYNLRTHKHHLHHNYPA